MIDPLKLHAYADGEATPDEIAEIEARLADCSASQAEVAAIRSFKECLSRHPQQTDHSECWKVCRGRLNELDRAHRTERFVGKYAWALATGIVGLVVLTGVARRGGNNPSLGSADLAQIMSQVGSPSRKPLDGREQAIARELLQRSRVVLNNDALQAVGMAEGQVDGMYVRRVTLRDGQGQMALLDLPGEARVEGLEPVSGTQMQSGQIDSYNCVVWPAGTHTFVLIGDRDSADLARVATQISSPR